MGLLHADVFDSEAIPILYLMPAKVSGLALLYTSQIDGVDITTAATASIATGVRDSGACVSAYTF